MNLKILHTSDFHLGKKLSTLDRLPEQKLFLNWLHEFIVNQSIDLLLISGDIFDTVNPPTECIKVYFDFLKKLSQKTACKTFIIAGNHDSGSFLNAPKNILHDLSTHICGKLQFSPEGHLSSEHSVTLCYEDYQINLVLLPYFRQHEMLVKNSLSIAEEESILSNDKYEQFFKKQFDALIKNRSPKHFNILMLHHLIEDYEFSGSEQMLFLSGLNGFNKSLFTAYFDYVALGHIHKFMDLSSEKTSMIYSGAPLQYRFDEGLSKQVVLLKLRSSSEGIHQDIETIPVPQNRLIKSLIINSDNYQSILQKYIKEGASYPLPPLLEITLSLLEPNELLVEEIHQLLKNNSIVDYTFKTSFNRLDNQESPQWCDQTFDDNLLDLFKLYYEYKFAKPIADDSALYQSFLELLETSRHNLAEETMEGVQ